SWSRQENVLVEVGSPAIAESYGRVFSQLWAHADVSASGDVDAVPVPVGAATVHAWFTPGRGTSLAHRIATRIDRARRRVRVCSPVISSGPILGTLAQVVSDRRV